MLYLNYKAITNTETILKKKCAHPKLTNVDSGFHLLSSKQIKNDKNRTSYAIL